MGVAGLANKLKLEPGQRVAIINAPAGYVEKLGRLPDGLKVVDKLGGTLDWIQIFVQNRSELEALLFRAHKALGPDGLLWVSYPKGSSRLPTDLNRDRLLEFLLKSDLKIITLVSVDDTWSAFSARPYRAGEPRQSADPKGKAAK